MTKSNPDKDSTMLLCPVIVPDVSRDFSYTVGMTVQLLVVALIVGGVNAAIIGSMLPNALVVLTSIGGMYGVAWAIMSNVEQYVSDHQQQIRD